MKIIEPQREISVLDEADVVVVGGGPSGIGAALAAARTGAQTILIDRFGSLGGLQTQGQNSMFAFVDPELHSGIIQEFLGRLKDAGAMLTAEQLPPETRAPMKDVFMATLGADKLPKRMVETEVGWWGRWGYCFDPEYYKYMLDGLMAEAGVKLLYHSFAVAAIREENLLKGVIVEGKEGRRAVLGKVVVDTTGTGDMIWKSRAPCSGDEGYPAGKNKGRQSGYLSTFYIGGVDQTKFDAFRVANKDDWSGMYGAAKVLAKAKAAGEYIIVDKIIVSQNWDMHQSGKIWIMTLLYAAREACWSTKDLTAGEIDMRKQAVAIHKALKENVGGFENSYIDRFPQFALWGNQHRLIGEHVLTYGDMRQGKIFEDAVAISNMPPDVYEVSGRFAYDILPYDVPYRSLVSKEVENLMAAGAIISAGAFGAAGIRYCTPSICTGQAAGTAAALAVKNHVTPKKLDAKLVQEALRKQGVRVSVKEVPPEALEPYQFIQQAKIVARRTKEVLISEEDLGKY